MPVASSSAVTGDVTLSLATIGAAWLLGAGSSLHCFLMCGPLACTAQLGAAARRNLAVGAAYHAARLAAYAVVGALAGAFGGVVGAALALPLAKLAPWLLAAVLIVSVLDPAGRRLKRLPPLPGLAKILRIVGAARARLSPPWQAALVGAVTPLLPCGLVYAVAAGAMASASPLAGALWMGAFALGAVPALIAAQVQTRWLRSLPPGAALVVQRALPLAAALVLIVRALGTARGHACH